MLKDKSADLDAEKRRKLLERLVMEVSKSGVDLYYTPTSQVAMHLLDYVEKGAGLNADERALLDGLSRRDIEVILSLK